MAVLAVSAAPGSGARAATPTSSRVTSLEALVAQARAQEQTLLAQVQTLRGRLAREGTEIGRARSQLAALVAAEYTGGSGGILDVIGSSSFNSALDSQIVLSRLTEGEQAAIARIRVEMRLQQADEATLVARQAQARVTEARLMAEEIAAAYLAANPPAPPASAQSSRQPSAPPTVATRPSAPSTPAPAPPPSATPPPPPTPTPAPNPAPASGPFSTTTNLTLPSGISLKQIQEFLQGTPLEADSSYFLQAEATNHVSAIYLVADAVLETGFGTSQLYLQKHNLFGFEAYDANPFGDGASFPSDQACISFVSWYVFVYYLTPPGSQVPNYPGQPGTVPTGKFYNGPTPAGMNVDYASDPLWASKIAAIGDQLQQMPS
jgi:flagellum-specific peptidoglycan hydrolase FlgJ